ncbi:zinc finger protein 677-like [Topomyia yanbarensis]|uniref:zinc finger protein 677-like n=1 Tax=Topomyia yanbarensis TaxID=2498891 RepID=UPI00273C05BC|nr:zinc finger protein 677-like [Topomyia yanbarensis]
MMTSSLVMLKNCRCCLVADDEMFYVFEVASEFGGQIAELIANCAGVVITETDCYSKLICGRCLKDLHVATRFRKRCLETELAFENIQQIHDIQEPIVKLEEPCDAEELSFPDNPITQPTLIKQETAEVVQRLEESKSNPALLISSVAERPTNIPSLMHSVADITPLPTLTRKPPAVLQSLGLKRTCSKIVTITVDNTSVQEFQQSDQHTSRSPEERFENSDTHDSTATTSNHQQTDAMHKCDLCEKQFSTVANLTKHQKQNHDRVRLFKCDICEREFYTVHHMTKHKRTHFDDRPHICNVCGKGFLENSHLEYHKRTHTGERPYKCDLCSKQFLRSSHLTQHRRKHTDGQQHKCELCGRGFSDNTALMRHKRNHTDERPHKCDFCGKQFRSNSYLMLHRRIHTGEKPHVCKVCGKAFIEKSQLTQHVRIHTSERPHICEICGKGFIQGGHLVQHKRIHLVG